MKLLRGVLMALLCWMHLTSEPAFAQASPHNPDDWRENYAYTLGMQAYIFGSPYVVMSQTRWVFVVKPPANERSPYAPINHFFHWRQLADASYKDGGGTNNDTVYSTAWLDLSKEPLILSHPDMGSRYFYFQLASFDADNFGAISIMATGSKAGSFALVGPDWKGELPPEIKGVFRSRTNHAFILGRTLLDRNEQDRAIVNRLQDQYTLIPLSYWGKPGTELPASRDVWKPWDRRADPLADWKTMNRAMAEDSPEARLTPLLNTFATIGVGPGLDVEAQDPATKRGLARAALDGRQMLLDINKSSHPFIWIGENGWDISVPTYGRLGLSDDFLRRAAIVYSGLVAPERENSTYYQSNTVGTGAFYDGSKAYTLTFPPGGLPKVNASGFWSVTMYNTATDNQYNLVPNPINRYSLGDRTRGLKYNRDGSLTFYIQSRSPGKARESNWLPSAPQGSFTLTFRTYLPGPDIIAQKWFPPPVVEVTAEIK